MKRQLHTSVIWAMTGLFFCASFIQAQEYDSVVYITTADAMVNDKEMFQNYGDHRNIAVQFDELDNVRKMTSFVRFENVDLAGKTVVAAWLMLAESEHGTSNNRNSGFDVREVTGNWEEMDVIWTNKPNYGEEPLGSYPEKSLENFDILHIDILTSIFSPGKTTYDFALVGTTEGTDAPFYSRTGLYDNNNSIADSLKPSLILKTQTGVGVFQNIAENRTVRVYPNPFTINTSIDFTIEEPGLFRVDILDINGRLVANLISEEKVPGDYKVYWDGKNSRANKIPYGIYICRTTLINTGGLHVNTSKLVYME